MIENGKRWVLQCLTPNQPPHTTFLKRSIISFFFILNSLISSSSISNYQRSLVAKRQIFLNLQTEQCLQGSTQFHISLLLLYDSKSSMTHSWCWILQNIASENHYEAAFYLSCFSCCSASIVILKNSEVYSHVI